MLPDYMFSHVINIVVFGPSGSGKTELIRQFANSNFTTLASFPTAASPTTSVAIPRRHLQAETHCRLSCSEAAAAAAGDGSGDAEEALNSTWTSSYAGRDASLNPLIPEFPAKASIRSLLRWIAADDTHTGSIEAAVERFVLNKIPHRTTPYDWVSSLPNIGQRDTLVKQRSFSTRPESRPSRESSESDRNYDASSSSSETSSTATEDEKESNHNATAKADISRENSESWTTARESNGSEVDFSDPETDVTLQQPPTDHSSSTLSGDTDKVLVEFLVAEDQPTENVQSADEGNERPQLNKTCCSDDAHGRGIQSTDSKGGDTSIGFPTKHLIQDGEDGDPTSNVTSSSREESASRQAEAPSQAEQEREGSLTCSDMLTRVIAAMEREVGTQSDDPTLGVNSADRDCHEIAPEEKARKFEAAKSNEVSQRAKTGIRDIFKNNVKDFPTVMEDDETSPPDARRDSEHEELAEPDGNNEPPGRKPSSPVSPAEINGEDSHQKAATGNNHTLHSTATQTPSFMFPLSSSDDYDEDEEDCESCGPAREMCSRVKFNVTDASGDWSRFLQMRISLTAFHALLLVYDVTDRSSFAQAAAWVLGMESNAALYCPDVITLVGNKAESNDRKVQFWEGDYLARHCGLRFLETSALQDDCVTHAFCATALDVINRLPRDNQQLHMRDGRPCTKGDSTDATLEPLSASGASKSISRRVPGSSGSPAAREWEADSLLGYGAKDASNDIYYEPLVSRGCCFCWV